MYLLLLFLFRRRLPVEIGRPILVFPSKYDLVVVRLNIHMLRVVNDCSAWYGTTIMRISSYLFVRVA